MLQHIQPPFTQLKYALRCTRCGATHDPDPFRLGCDADHEPALLRAVYAKRQLQVKSEIPGLFRFMDWLPVERALDLPGKPITYQSQHLARHLGLDQLYVTFNGYWPERQAALSTCSFKELEAPTVLARIPVGHPRSLVIASAGNTGRAFATVCSRLRIPLCLVIPERSLPAMWSSEPFHPCVCLVVVGGGGDYTDAIALSNLISNLDGFFPEGGAANVGRRDGMGLTVVDAAVTLGRIPDHYFQAVGSGTGGISAWEANLRLLDDGRFGSHHMRLHLSQNIPFTPMVDAWKTRRRSLTPLTDAAAKARVDQVAAQVLTNRNPAYSITGGLYEALVDTNGVMYSVTNEESDQARRLFEDLEGIDICPASGVATASLLQAVEAGTVNPQECILLNITSGGVQRMQRDSSLHYLRPNLVFSPDEICPEIVARRLEKYTNVSRET